MRFWSEQRLSLSTSNAFLMSCFHFVFPSELRSTLSFHAIHNTSKFSAGKTLGFLQFECYTRNYSRTVAWWLALKETKLLFKITNKTKFLCQLKHSAILHISKWLLIIEIMSFCSYLLPFPPPKVPAEIWPVACFHVQRVSFLCCNTQRWRIKLMKRQSRKWPLN